MSEILIPRRDKRNPWAQAVRCRICGCTARYFENDVFVEDDDTFRAWCAGQCGSSVKLDPPMKVMVTKLARLKR
jgi:hypothetical protein